jgi:hypothetical protein
MPARSIRRCETIISASFEVSFRIGRKNRDNRMGTPGESGEREVASETGSGAKTQGEAQYPAAGRQNSCETGCSGALKSRCSNLQNGSPDA